MSLPVTNLDDRKFQDLVDEAKRNIPKYCPTWTNHNLSDPGVALIELFAWMTEMSLFRINQVPDVFYTRMLNLLGFKPFPATAARADVTFWLVSALNEAITVSAGTQVSTTGEIGPTRVFTTLEDLVIRQPQLSAALRSDGYQTYQNVWDQFRLDRDITWFRDPIRHGDCFYIGFAESLAGNALQIDIKAKAGTGPDPDNPPLKWEVSWRGEQSEQAILQPGDEQWVSVYKHSDTTGGLNRNGTIVLLLPNVHDPVTLGGEQAYWLRARLLTPERNQPAYRESPTVHELRVSSIGGTVTAEHSDLVGREVLGTSNGLADQVFVCRHTPVLPRAEGETVVVEDENGSVAWTEVADFSLSGPNDRHFVWDPTTGEIHFGPLIRYPGNLMDPNGTYRQHGRVPDEGAHIVVTGYRFGGGAIGNVGSGTINSLRTTIPYVSHVTNTRPSSGGVDAETVDNAKRRGPETLRAGERAVTKDDFERLAVQADPAIARVRCLPPLKAGKPIRLLLVPKIERDSDDLSIDEFALPPLMIERVMKHLEERRILGSSIEIGVPYYQGVSVAALVFAQPGRNKEKVAERAVQALNRFLNPLSGGPDGTGWPFETDLNAASVDQLLMTVEGLERVDKVLLFDYDLRNYERLGKGKQLIKLARDSLFMSASHQVVVK